MTAILFPALAMSLGWGLRGYIGGGPLGAMIPGAMVALAICLLLRRRDAAVAAAFGAAGIGFGGQMTYGQTVGFIVQPDTYWWGLLGLSLKGGVWGLLGGGVLGAGLTSGSFSRRRILSACTLLMGGVWTGWKLINEPKLIYFSNRLDKPRPEIWAGLLLGGLLWLAVLGRRTPVRFALLAAIGGAIGFGGGASLMVQGRSLPVDQRWFDWWKLMEFTFGFLFGAALGLAARKMPTEGVTPATGRMAPGLGLLLACLLCLAVVGVESSDLLRFWYTAGGVLILAAALYSAELAWQGAITVTVCAFAADCGGWRLAVAAGAAAWWFARGSRTVERMFLVLMWAAVADSWLKSATHGHLRPGHVVVEAIFTAMAIVLHWWARRIQDRSIECATSLATP